LGHVWATAAPGQVVESIRGAVIETLHEMPVTIECDLNRRVPKALLDHLGVLAGSDQPGGVRVTEVVDPTGTSDRVSHGLAPDPAERTPPEEIAPLCAPKRAGHRLLL
jgi:hypothetical protein